MENNRKEFPALTRKALIILLTGLTGVIAIVIMVFSVVSVNQTLLQYNRDYLFPGNQEKSDPLRDQNPDDLHPELAFSRSRLAGATDDSLTLTVNLHDSLLTLEYKGVVLHTARIHHIHYSNFFSRMEPWPRFQLFSKPSTVKKQISSISHEPVIYRKAPRDTLEAQQTNILPDTNRREPVFVAFYLDTGIRLELTQTEPAQKGLFRKTRQDVRKKISGSFVKDLLHFRIPEYQPWIRISTSWRDARTIYRAMPLNSKIVLYMPGLKNNR